MNRIKALWASLAVLVATMSVGLAQSPAYVTEAETAIGGLQTNIEGLLPEAFAIAVLIFAAPFVWRFVRRFVR